LYIHKKWGKKWKKETGQPELVHKEKREKEIVISKPVRLDRLGWIDNASVTTVTTSIGQGKSLMAGKVG